MAEIIYLLTVTTVFLDRWKLLVVVNIFERFIEMCQNTTANNNHYFRREMIGTILQTPNIIFNGLILILLKTILIKLTLLEEL